MAGACVNPGYVYTAQVYSVSVSVTAVAGDTPSTIHKKLADKINAMTAAQWNAKGSAPKAGTPGFKPTALVGTDHIKVILNYQNQMSFSASGTVPKVEPITVTPLPPQNVIQPSTTNPTSWSTTRGAPGLPFWAWGYTKDTAGNPVKFPKITVKTPSGQLFGGVYTGDSYGAWNMALPSDQYILEITAPGYKTYTHPAKNVSGGYRLVMEKLPVATPPPSPINPLQVTTPVQNPNQVTTPITPGQVTTPTTTPVVQTPLQELLNPTAPASEPTAIQPPATTPVQNDAPLTVQQPSTTETTQPVEEEPKTVINAIFPPAHMPFGVPMGSGGGGAAGSMEDATPEQKELYKKARNFFWLSVTLITMSAFLFHNKNTNIAGGKV
jgi:hypothetical protein